MKNFLVVGEETFVSMIRYLLNYEAKTVNSYYIKQLFYMWEIFGLLLS